MAGAARGGQGGVAPAACAAAAEAGGRVAQGRRMMELWQTIAVVVGAFAALLAGIYAVVTRPIQRQLAAILRRLDRIETKLEDHSRRVVEITAGRRGGKMVRFGRRRRASIREMPRR